MHRASVVLVTILVASVTVPALAQDAPRAAAAPAHGDWFSRLPKLSVPTIDVGGFRIQLGGYVQGQYAADQHSDTQLAADGSHLLNRDAFQLRRGRLLLVIERSIARMLLELDASSGVDGGLGVRVIRAEATVQWPEAPNDVPYAALTVGLFRTPFGEEVQRSPRDRLFMEGSTPLRALFPGETDLGVRLAGGVEWIRYALAVVNGHPIDEARFGGRAPTPSGDVVGRVGIDVKAGGVHLAGGLSLLGGTGFHPGTAATKDVIVVHNASESGMLGASDLLLVPGRAAVPSLTYGRWAVGADLQINGDVGRDVAYWFRAEGVVAQNLDRGLYLADPIATGFDVRELGVTASWTQLFWRWLVVGARLDYYDPFLDAQSRIGGALMRVPQWLLTASFAVGVQWPGSQTRFVVEYDKVIDHLALGSNGLPVDLNDDRLTVRLQVAF